jgi:hypothetical protein
VDTVSGVIAPVGRCVGPLAVRSGDAIVELTEEDYAIWALATGSRAIGLRDDDAAPPTRDLLGGLLGARAVDRLLAGGLLVEVPADAAAFARTHRLVPALLGLGSSSRRAGYAGIGLPGREIVTVPVTVYEVWARSGGYRTLWSACGESGRVLAEVLGRLHALLSCCAASLEVVDAG